ncbi:ABC transporter ATP-binding protein [Polynucleobacter necessarius]|uniref:ABC transporter ATP-binding protein n=1 Tax=Polynucleobacter necessarius TaxID=576610 RepID=UPI001E509EEE|nr:ABC transporter ATP-binding protein [Polynucleobacter necessarius]
MNTSIFSLLGRLWRHITLRRRKQFVLLLLLMLLASFAEILSIGTILPFLGVLTAPERIFEAPSAQFMIQYLGLFEPKQLLLPLTIAFILSVLMAGTMRLMLLWASTRLSFATGADLSIDIYRRTLYQPYSIHCARNSSEVINGISGKANGVIYSVVFPALTLISSSVMLIAILITLLMLEPVIALIAFGGFGFIYLAIVRLTRKQLMLDSECIARESTQVIKALQEGLGGIRDVLIDGSQEIYSEIYRRADALLRRAQGNSLFIGFSPRYGMEALGMVLISTLAYMLAQQVDGIAKTIPLLGALALGAQRLLPVLQQAYGSWAQMSSGKASLVDTLELLDQPMPLNAYDNNTKLPFNQCMALKQIEFRYGSYEPNVLNKIDLIIPKGSRVGFIGTTGSGKSTLLDILMGLLQPTNGLIEIDGAPITFSNARAWQAHIAHVPQTIFLIDSTIEENIAFGIPKNLIDHSQVRASAQRAQIADTIENWPNQYSTVVGERGIRLSGGQRQRIGIARALYKKADVIIFDEATSALDGETERAVMHSIENLSHETTILIIAHRLTTLKDCTQIVELIDGNIKSIGKFQDFVNRST